jgi:hypothetical protein
MKQFKDLKIKHLQLPLPLAPPLTETEIIDSINSF